MRATVGAIVVATLAGALQAHAAGLPAPPALTHSPWNGEWVLSATRNPVQIKEAAAEGYRFTLGPGDRIRWEIPSLHEVVEGRTDGRPMTIRRPGTDGLALAVTAHGPWALSYVVSKAGAPVGEGRMTLVDQGRAWVDLTGPYRRPDLTSVVIYVRPDAAAR